MPRKKNIHKTDETKGGYITGKLPQIGDYGEVILSSAQVTEVENILCTRTNLPIGDELCKLESGDFPANFPKNAHCGICLSWRFHDRLTGKDLGICNHTETFTERNSVCEKWKGQNG